MNNNYIRPIDIDHSQYNKISDDLLILGQNAILKFNVTLIKHSEQYGKMSYHREIKYVDKYHDDTYMIKRSFDYYLSIENLKATDNGTKEFIRIGLSEILIFRDLINRVMEWFTSSEFKELYAIKNDKLIMLGRPNPISLDSLPMNKSIIMEPTIYRDANEKDRQCIRMYLSSDSNFVDMTLDRFMAFKYLIDNINLYQSAQELVNYLGRPELGSNLYSVNSDSNESGNKIPANSGNKVGRVIPNKSAFDK